MRDTRFRSSFVFTLAATAALLSLTPTTAAAQEPPEPPTASGEEGTPPAAPERPDFPSAPSDDPARRPPYSGWKKHLAAAPGDAVARVWVDIGDGSPPRSVSAVVVRCDGLLLVPLDVAYDLDRRAKVTIAVREAEGEKLTERLVGAGRVRVNAPAGRLDYGLIKVNGHHLRGLRLLGHDALTPGTPVRVSYAVPDPKNPALCAAVTLRATVGPETDRTHRTLKDFTGDDGKPLDAARIAAVPPGAAVIDEETGTAVGIYTRTGASPEFTTLREFGNYFNEAGVAATRAAVFGYTPKGKEGSEVSAAVPSPPPVAATVGEGAGVGIVSPDGMVTVEGGAVRLRGRAAREALQFYGTDIACTPAFQIDVNPVTYKEYLRWVRDEKRRAVPLPKTWGFRELDDPIRHPDQPAAGMRPVEAMWYANERNKRLPTAAEWQLASRLNSTDFLRAHLEEMQRLARMQQHVRDMYGRWRREAQALAALQERAARGRRGAGAEPSVPEPPPELVQAAAEVHGLLVAYNSKGWGPDIVAPIDFWPEDLSTAGVRLTAMNVPEILLPRGYAVYLAPKLLPASTDPYISFVNGTSPPFPSPTDPNRNVQYSTGGPRYYYQLTPLELAAFPDALFYFSAGSSTGMGTGTNVPTTVPTRGGGTLQRAVSGSYSWAYQWVRRTEPGFRCAR